MKQVISVVNLKGGVGKTTTAVNIAACMGEIGKKVLLIDMDPQGSATLCLGKTDSGEELLAALQNTTALPVVSTDVPGLDLVPSGMALTTTGQWFTNAASYGILSSCIEQTAGDWEYIFIDCPPAVGFQTMNALRASQHVVIPAEASFLGLNGLKQMVTTVESVKAQNPALKIEAIIPCRAHRRRRVHWEIMGSLEEMFPGKISPIIRENVALTEAPGKGKPVILSANKSKGADDYRLVTLWIDEKVSMPQEIVVNDFSFAI